MIDVNDIKGHIKGLFRINEPFDLFLNEVEYLPPNEDVRILKENETVLVVPKSQLSNIQLSNIQLSSTKLTDELHVSVSTSVSSIDTSRQDLENNSAHPKQTEPTSIYSSSPKNPPQQEQLPINSHVAKLSPVQQKCPADITDKSQSAKENTDTEVPYVCARRKRARRRRSSKLEQPLLNEENKSSKANVINSKVVPLGKHIRFDNVDDKICLENPVTCPETMKEARTTVSPVHELTNLLSMANNSTPLTFENNRVKNTANAKHVSNEVNASHANVSESIASIKELGESKEFENADFETYPVMTTKPKVNNVIAFKMLKIASDFTPQISNFIVAQVVSYNPEKSLYIFKILQGLSEVQVPVGKFNFVEDSEERVINDTIKLHYAQIMKPRLVSA